MAVDLNWMVRNACENHSKAAGDLLGDLLGMRHDGDRRLVVKAKLILGGYFTEKGLAAEAARIRDNLADMPRTDLAAAGDELLTLQDRSFWEVTDRQMMFEWVPPEYRPFIADFLASFPAAS
jgi:hypothetical protein